MVRTLLLFVFAAVLIAAAWLRVEADAVPLRETGTMLALALVPVLAVAFGRRRLVVAVAASAATLVAASAAFDVPLTDARPRDAERDFFGPVGSAVKQGFLDFYETELPFVRADSPLMHGLILLAVFGFVAAAGMLIAGRRPVGAAIVLVTALGWPATLIPGEQALRAGALALAGVLAILFLLRERAARPARGLTQALVAGVVLVAVATVASTSDSVAKGAFLRWQAWDPYDRPDPPVSVRYVWDSHYSGISFPKEKTVVLKVKVQGPRRLYWRATTLDEYTGTGWREAIDFAPATTAEEIDASRQRLAQTLPPAARDEENWVRQEVTVEALRDDHLIGSAQPVRWRPPESALVQEAAGDVVVLPRSLHQGQRYTVWSYVTRAKPSELAPAGTDYPAAVARFLEPFRGARVLPFGTPGRAAQMEAYFAQFASDFAVTAHRPLYDQALDVVGGAKSPYAAAVALEAWFRTEGGFTYDESPPFPAPGEPALAAFVQHRRGYCQHYAGAMAVMLRLLGVPARVAAGFTSGDYDADEREWTVTDHNAHTWVEAFFPGFGWVPFDPTPGRGDLGAQYSAASFNFAADDAFRDPSLLGESAVLDALRGRLGQNPRTGREPGQTPGGGSGGGASVVRDQAPSLIALALAVIAAGLLAVTALKAVRRGLRFATRDPRALAAACRRDLVGFLADQGIELPASATLAEVGSVIEHDFTVETGPFVRSATAARFGPPRHAAGAVRRARRELRLIRRQVRSELGIPGRIRGAVSLRSLTL